MNDAMAKGTRVSWVDPYRRRRRSGVVLVLGRAAKGSCEVYLVQPDDGLGQTVAMPNGEVFEAVEVHPDRLSRVSQSDNGRTENMYAKGDYVKVEFRDEQSGEVEWMWVKVESDDPAFRIVFGALDSEPIVCTDLRLGQQLAVSYDNIRDHRTPTSFKPT